MPPGNKKGESKALLGATKEEVMVAASRVFIASVGLG